MANEYDYPVYDAGGRVEVYREGGEVKPTSISKTSAKFQGTPEEIAKKILEGIPKGPNHLKVKIQQEKLIESR